MIFGVGLQVFRQMSDPAGEEGHLHIRAAGILLMKLERREIHCVAAFCHKRASIVAPERPMARRGIPASGVQPCRLREQVWAAAEASSSPRLQFGIPHFYILTNQNKHKFDVRSEALAARPALLLPHDEFYLPSEDCSARDQSPTIS